MSDRLCALKLHAFLMASYIHMIAGGFKRREGERQEQKGKIRHGVPTSFRQLTLTLGYRKGTPLD